MAGSLLTMVISTLLAPMASAAVINGYGQVAAGPAKYKVPLEAHIMSKCPDAKYCFENLIMPVMERTSDKVDWRTSFIAKPAAKGDGLECLHGPGECVGNMVMLCAAELYPDPKITLGFTNCLLADYKQIPDQDYIKGCALEHGIDIKALNHCTSQDNGAHALNLLRDSAQRTTDANVKYSCTVRLENDIWCVRDGGVWKDCPEGSDVDTLASAIEDIYDNHNSKSC